MGIMFTRKERRMVESLQAMGYTKGLSNVLVYFSRCDNGRCKDIQTVTSLRQPEVSMALKTMKDKGWVGVRMLPTTAISKGRPVNDYVLKQPFENIVSEIAAREEQDLERKRAIINGLRQDIRQS